MENRMYILEPLIDKAEGYAKTSFELCKLKTVSKSAAIISTFVSRGFVIVSLSLFMVFVNIGLAIWLGNLLGKLYLGFFCIAIFYVLLATVLYFFMHNYIKKQVSNAIVSEMLN